MARAKSKETKEKKELPALNCCKCKKWVETMEKDPSFRTEEDVAANVTPRAWVCPACRGEVAENPPSTTELERKARKAADREADRQIEDEAMTAKYGPARAIKRIVEDRPSSRKVELECGHQVTIGKTTKNARCRYCMPKKEKKPRAKSERKGKTTRTVRTPTSDADLDAKWGPVRQIKKVLEARAKSKRVLYDCKHEGTISGSAKSGRCGKCKKEAK